MSFPTTGLLDDFAGASGADASFTEIDGGTGFAGVNRDGSGNGITAVSTKFAWAYYNPGTFGPDSECYVTVSSVGTAANALRVLARVTNPGTTSWTGYFVGAQLFTATAWTIQRHDVGGNVTLATGPSQALAVGDQVGIEIVGTVINAKYKPSGGAWSTLFSYDTAGDATKYSAAGYLATEFGLKSSKLADFNGGTVVAGGAQTILSGRVASGVAVRGGTPSGVLASIPSGRISSTVAVRGGSLRGVLASILSGRIASGASARGGTLSGVRALVSSGRIGSASAARGGTPTGTGVVSISSGRIGSQASARGGSLRGVLASILSGRIGSLAQARGGILSRLSRRGGDVDLVDVAGSVALTDVAGATSPSDAAGVVALTDSLR